ncbi:MAG: hypothetical protein KC431_01960, partial [Myxococcales bacterium]|nr:hypothetical protein [Myxococcales bacterium]
VDDEAGSEVTGIDPTEEHPSCQVDDPALASFALENLPPGPHDLACSVGAISIAEDGSRGYELQACESLVGGQDIPTLNFSVTLNPESLPNIATGATVRLRALVEDEGTFFTLHLQPGGLLLLAGAGAQRLLAEDPLIDLEPFSLSLTEHDCAGEEPCGQSARMFVIIESSTDHDYQIAADGGYVFVSETVPYLLAVERARIYGPSCAELGPARFDYLISLVPQP